MYQSEFAPLNLPPTEMSYPPVDFSAHETVAAHAQQRADANAVISHLAGSHGLHDPVMPTAVGSLRRKPCKF